MVVTFVFGIVPATFLLMFALVFGAAGVAAVVSSVWVGDAGRALFGGLLVIPVTVMAVYGYMGLFHAAGDMVTLRVARWLLAGIIATVAYVGLLAMEPEYQALESWYLFFSPSIVAGAHLARFLARSRERRTSA